MRPVLRGQGDGLHLDLSGLGTAAAFSWAASPSKADAPQASPPSAAGQQGAFEAPDTLHANPGSRWLTPPVFQVFVGG